METTRIPLSQCVESSYQNRKELGDVSGLARSIEVNGQITPLIVVADGETYQLVAGHRCTAAMRSLRLDEADAYVMDGWDDARIAQILNAENNHRREMIALAWFAEHEDAMDMPVRFDNIAMLVMGDSRVMIRHHLNALGGDIEQLQPQAAAGILTGADLQTLPEAA